MEVPDGATHFSGNLEDHPLWHKCVMIAAYEYWFVYNPMKKEWVFISYFKPHWIEEIVIGDNLEIYIQGNHE